MATASEIAQEIKAELEVLVTKLKSLVHHNQHHIDAAAAHVEAGIESVKNAVETASEPKPVEVSTETKA